TPREGLAVFDGDELVAANRHALELLGLDWNALGRRRYDELFRGAAPASGRVGRLRDAAGAPLHVRRDGTPRHAPARAEKPAPPRGGALRTLGAAVVDDALEQQLRRAARLLDADVPLLLEGETGTGKEVFARELHRRSARAGAAFVAVNCAALPEGLIEAELFGYAGGAFTGARREGARGLLREADGGVLFLDEIGDMPLVLQSRLLRVLQEREVAPLGGGRAQRVDFAVVAASHRDLERAVAEKTFRADLYFRIAQSTVRLRPLREYERLDRLIRALWTTLGGDAAQVALADEAVARLAAHAWPGNFRQLVGTLKSLLALAEPGDTVDARALPERVRAAAAPRPLAGGAADPAPPDDVRALGEIERDAVRRALAASDGNVSAAARRLGISRSTLYRRFR
ncbi:MAG TPA: sigma 54-interacting transcriptional regulator, partial [Dokdonella sp.]